MFPRYIAQGKGKYIGQYDSVEYFSDRTQANLYDQSPSSLSNDTLPLLSSERKILMYIPKTEKKLFC